MPWQYTINSKTPNAQNPLEDDFDITFTNTDNGNSYKNAQATGGDGTPFHIARNLTAFNEMIQVNMQACQEADLYASLVPGTYTIDGQSIPTISATPVSVAQPAQSVTPAL